MYSEDADMSCWETDEYLLLVSMCQPSEHVMTKEVPSGAGSEQRKHEDHEDPYAFLHSFETVFLVNERGLFNGARWRETIPTSEPLTPVCAPLGHDSGFENAKRTLYDWSHCLPASAENLGPKAWLQRDHHRSTSFTNADQPSPAGSLSDYGKAVIALDQGPGYGYLRNLVNTHMRLSRFVGPQFFEGYHSRKWMSTLGLTAYSTRLAFKRDDENHGESFTRAWDTRQCLGKSCKPLIVAALLAALPKAAANPDIDPGQPIPWPPADLSQTWIDYAWNLIAPAVPIVVLFAGFTCALWTLCHKPKNIPQLPKFLTVTAPVCGLVYLSLRSTAPGDVLLSNIVGSLWAMACLNLICRAYLALAQPQSYCWLSFVVGALIYVSLTMTEWISEEMDIGHKVCMGAECVTVASALLPKVLDRKPGASLLPK